MVQDTNDQYIIELYLSSQKFKVMEARWVKTSGALTSFVRDVQWRSAHLLVFLNPISNIFSYTMYNLHCKLQISKLLE